MIEHRGLRPELFKLRLGDSLIHIIGRPEVNDSCGSEHIARAVERCLRDDAGLQSIGGSFLFAVANEAESSLTIITDRFASVPFYFSVTGGRFFASIDYITVLTHLLGQSATRLVEESFLEFIHFQRLLGDKTFDTATRFLNSASVLRYTASNGSIQVRKYWRPSFGKDRKSSPDDLADLLAQLTRRSTKRILALGSRAGLLLSGGLDSRIVLAAAERPVTCMTVGYRENNEVRVARSAAEARKFPHVFIQRPGDHYSTILDDSVKLGGAMNVFDHAHFLRLKEIGLYADMVLHGHGFDYLFQGLYLPTRAVSIMGRPTFFQRLAAPGADFADWYIWNVRFRLKEIDFLRILRPRARDRALESLRTSVDVIAREVRDEVDSPYDLWEYMHLHNISRHYTNLNVASIRVHAEEATVAFDNQILDLFWRTPAERRVGGDIARKALRVLNPVLARVPNANTNLRADAGQVAATVLMYTHLARRKLRLFRDEWSLPGPDERSWPVRAAVTRDIGVARRRVLALKSGDSLDVIAGIDRSEVAEVIDSHLEGRRECGALMNTLLTIDSFVRILNGGTAA